MISRYEVSEISSIWSDHNKYKTFLAVELALLQAWEELDTKIPTGISQKISELVKINNARVDEIEQTTRHDVIAFCSMITEQLPPELGRWFHFGVTSSDIIDTALSLQIKQSLTIVKNDLRKLFQVLATRSEQYKYLPTLGRSHGMAAEPTSFGQKLLGHYAEFARRFEELDRLISSSLSAQFSGAVGNYVIMGPDVEKRAAAILNLEVEPVSTQIIPRDRIAGIIHWGAQLANAIERLCVELRHLHRSEVGEIHEGFAKGQKGSSTMPHKKNPVSAENLTGLARLLRSHATIADENTILWHERDISHSSAERLMLPDHFGLLTYALRRLSSTVEDLVIHEDVIKQRVQTQEGFLSSYYLHYLLTHSKASREELYAQVQSAAFSAKKPGAFKQLLEQASRIKLPETTQTLGLAHVDSVFERVFKRYPSGKIT